MTTKQKVWKVIKKIGGFACVLLGLAIGGFGVSQFLPEKKKYAGGNVSLPDKDQEEEKTE
jgi:hypothetical protein